MAAAPPDSVAAPDKTDHGNKIKRKDEVSRPEPEEDEDSGGENIYLFLPNLIGMPSWESSLTLCGLIAFLPLQPPSPPSRLLIGYLSILYLYIHAPTHYSLSYVVALADTSLFCILGYSRIVLALASLYYMPLHPRTCSLFYSISSLLDALDGYAARYFEQSTRFGAVLDMVTDRCTTTCLLVFLSSAFPRWTIIFQGLIALDLASHYIHMYATLAMGGSTESHKNIDKTRSRLLNLYYTNKVRPYPCTLPTPSLLFTVDECPYPSSRQRKNSLIYLVCSSNFLPTLDRPIRLLRPQRDFLYRVISSRLLQPVFVPGSLAERLRHRRRDRWRRSGQPATVGQGLYQPLQCCCARASTCEQDGIPSCPTCQHQGLFSFYPRKKLTESAL